jgi:hypothetical protein
MSSPSTSRPSSPILSKDAVGRTGSFRSHSPSRPVQIEHQIPNHPHLHIHTIRSPILNNNGINSNNNNDSAIYDDDVSPPSSISAQILAPFLNAPVPSSFKTPSSQTSTSSNTNGHQSRGANARANALGAASRSSSVKRYARRRASNEDNSVVAEFLDLLGVEGGKVDAERIEKMRCLARERGVPNHLRKYVWPLLLGECVQRERITEEPDCDAEEKLAKISKRIRGELSRYHRRKNRRALPQSSAVTPSAAVTTPPQESSLPSSRSSIPSSPSTSPSQEYFLDDAPLDLAVECTIIAFLTSNPDIEYSPSMVYLALTLAQWIYLPSLTPHLPGFSDDPNVLLRDTFAGALSLFGQLPSSCPMRPSRQNSTISLISVVPSSEAAKFPSTHRISQFLSAFRLVMPELASYFDDEGIGGWGDDWVGGWVGWFCAKELCGKINDEVKARLWDVYFSYPPTTPHIPDGGGVLDDVDLPDGPGEDLHIYVCIALLKSCADALEVLEQSEIQTLLQQLPPVEDVEGILREAKRIKEKVQLVEREEEEGYLARKSSGGSRSGSEKNS